MSPRLVVRSACRGSHLFVATLFALAAGQTAFAGGMALTMQNGAHLGHAYSAGASAEDASTVYFNPAGLTHLRRPELLVATAYVDFTGGYRDTGSTTAGVLPTAGGDGDGAGKDSLVPTAYLAYPVSEKLVFGFGVSSPFGLATQYAPDWVGRYHAIKSELITINLSPAVAWRVSERVSVGVGFDWQHASAELTNAVDFGLVGYANSIPGFLPGGADGLLRIKGDDATTGFHAGVLFDVSDATVLGVNFRSKIEHELSGTARFTNVPAPFAPMFTDQGASAALPLPEILSVSLLQQIGTRAQLVADWSMWNWSRFQSLAVDFENPLTPDTVLPQRWKDASIYSVGLRWRQSKALTLRAGLAYNETPVPSATLRSPRIPDSDRVWIAIGASWSDGETVRVDVGFARLFMKESSIHADDGFGHTLNGEFSMGVNILSTQASWNF